MAFAETKSIRIAPRKMRLVCDLIRGKNLVYAMNILEHTNKASSLIIQKLIKSAAANAVNNEGKDVAKLFVKEIYVNEGPTMKRFQPRAHGRAFEILKRTSHIRAVVDEGGK